MQPGIQNILADVGFSSINIVTSSNSAFAAQLARLNGFFAVTTGLFHSNSLTNLTSPKGNVPALLPGRKDMVSGEGSRLPFFDFFVCLGNRDPTRNEIGQGEIFNDPGGTNAATATKLIGAPIVLAAGLSSTTGMQKALGQVNSADHGNLLANIVCHEIGHSLGLRHAVTLDSAPPYTDSDVLSRHIDVHH